MDVLIDRPNGRLGVMVVFHDADGKPLEKPLTQQNFVEDCDINNIVQRFRKTGNLPQAVVNGIYGDFSEVGTYQDAMIKIEEANDMFDSLPAKIRARFNHDPAEFLDFAADNGNREELKKMGLIVEEASDLVSVPVVDDIVKKQMDIEDNPS